VKAELPMASSTTLQPSRGGRKHTRCDCISIMSENKPHTHKTCHSGSQIVTNGHTQKKKKSGKA
jgi:hypothetical protein